MSHDPEELLESTRKWVEDHINAYLSSGGADGHIVDLNYVGGLGLTPTLLLQTKGRRSGRTSIVPLIYGFYGGEWVVIGSKGGAPDHPAWFLNLQEQRDVYFQVATQAFRGSWRIAEGEEREAVWNYMAMLYPPYNTYKQTTEGRRIPVIMLKPAEPAPVFTR